MTYPIKKVRDGLFRGPRPTSGKEITEIAQFGIKYVLNLEDRDETVYAEKIAMLQYGIKTISDPWGEILPPSFKQLDCASITTKHVQPLLVHCLHGQDRTGAAILADRVINCGWDFDKAYKEMLDNGHNVFFYFWWKKRLRDFANKYGYDRHGRDIK